MPLRIFTIVLERKRGKDRLINNEGTSFIIDLLWKFFFLSLFHELIVV